MDLRSQLTVKITYLEKSLSHTAEAKQQLNCNSGTSHLQHGTMAPKNCSWRHINFKPAFAKFGCQRSTAQ